MAGARETRSIKRTTPPSASPPSAHHSTKQKRDSRGRFARKSGTTPASRSRNVQAKEAPRMFPGIPDIPPGFTEADRNVNRVRGAAQTDSSLRQPEVPEHPYVFIVNPKVAIHCTFSRESDDETEHWPIPSNREIKRQVERARVLIKRKYFTKNETISISDDDGDSDSSSL